MRLIDVARLLDGERLNWPRGPSIDVAVGHASDQMSEVLSSAEPGAILLTGLTNGQVMRTAEVAGLVAVVFVGCTSVPPTTVASAREAGIPTISTPLPMFEACGRLYARGMRGCASPDGRNDSFGPEAPQ